MHLNAKTSQIKMHRIRVPILRLYGHIVIHVSFNSVIVIVIVIVIIIFYMDSQIKVKPFLQLSP